MRDIRKVCVGPDYKDSMCYVVGQPVLGGSHHIHLIREENGSIVIYIEHSDIVVLWKEFNAMMPISIEYNINF